MAAALARHDAILRAAIEDAGGTVFKTVGDAFCAVFDSPLDAVHAALAAQRQLLIEDWSASGPDFAALRVRMGIHSGSPDARGGDYFGPDVNRVARLMSAGHGGQVLVSGAAASLVADMLPQDASLRDLGERRLKDLRQPDHVFQLAAPGLVADFPPLATLDARPNNLPMQLTALIGREAELLELARMLRADAGPRLITLTGPGGTGKTRLALQAAADLIDDFDHGVWWVDLSPLVDPDLVLPTIAKVLGVDEVPGVPIEDTLTAWLSQRALLLALDNHEQLLPAAPLAARLLAAAPRMKVLATSREPLHLRGERVFPVEPLAVPDLADGAEPQQVIQSAAVQLFVQRAVDVQPSFAITRDSAPAVAQICVRLDGLPLAIELAAARIDRFAPAAMLTQIEARLGLLVDGYRDLPGRQQTMRRAIAWSYDLLTDAEQRLFRRLGVFAGGWNLKTAEVVTAQDIRPAGPDPALAVATQDRLEGDRSASDASDGEPIDTPMSSPVGVAVLDGINSLIAKSLVKPIAGPTAEPRFSMLETIREFGKEQLATSGEASFITAGHARLFSRTVERAYREETYFLDWDTGWRTMNVESDNIRAALDWAVNHDPSLGLQLLARSILPLSEKMAWLERYAGGLERVPALAKAAAARVEADHAFALGRFQLAEVKYREELALGGAAADETVQTDAAIWVAWCLFQQASFDACDLLLDGVVADAERLNRRGTLLFALDARWQVAAARGQLDLVLPLREIRRTVGMRLGEPAEQPPDYHFLMYHAYKSGELDKADQHLVQFLQAVKDSGGTISIWDLDSVGRVHLAGGRSQQAAAAFLAGLRIARDNRWMERDAIPWHIEGLAGAARQQRAPMASAMLRGAADAWRTLGNHAIPPVDQADHDAEVAALRAVLGDDGFDAAWQQGRAMTPDEALALAEATVTTARHDDPTDCLARKAAID